MTSRTRKMEWIATFCWMGILLVLQILSDHYTFFNNAQLFIFPFCWIGSWVTRLYIKRKD